MKTILFWAIILSVSICQPVHGQFLKQLQKRAQDAVERTVLRKTDEVATQTTEKVIDGAISGVDGSETTNNQNSSSNQIEQSNTALAKHTQAKRDFYKDDMVIKISENGEVIQTQYFDANEIAVKTQLPNKPKANFIDSEGFVYVFKDGEYTKSAIIALQSQGMMVPTMMVNTYKLPPEPVMANLQKQHDLGMTANPFNGFVEFASIYKPEQFRYEDFNETKQTINGKTYTKFEFLNEPGYEGSYVLFDEQNRLTKIVSKRSESVQSQDMQLGAMPIPPGEDILEYEYTNVDVQLPAAREVRMQGQGLMELVMGNAKGGNTSKMIDDSDYDTSDSRGLTKTVNKSISNHKISINDLPESYDFDWKYNTKMVMSSKKQQEINMVFLIKEGANYQATQMTSPDIKDMGNTTMLFDNNLKTMVMFIEANGSNFLQLYPIPDVSNASDLKNDYTITQLPSKSILGYDSKGLQMEDDRYIIQLYHATGTPITLSNFLNFGNTKASKLPDIDPRIAKQFNNGLIMEMHLTDKKKSKNSVSIIAQSLNKTATTIQKSDYKSMDILSIANSMKN